MHGDQFTLHGAIQRMRDDFHHDVVLLQPTTLDVLRNTANIGDASTHRRGSTKTSVQLDNLAALMAQLMKNGGTSPPAPTAAATTTATTVPATLATTVTTTTTSTGPPRTDDRTVNIDLVMPEDAERSGNTVYAPGCGCRFRRGRARVGCGR